MILPLQQHPHYRQALRRVGAQVSEVAIASAAPVQVFQRFGLRFAPRGPVWLGNADADALRGVNLRLINSNGGDTSALQRAGYRQIMTPATIAGLPLSTDLDALCAQMHGKWRNIWRGAQKQPIRIAHSRFDARKHRWLLDADLAQQREKRFRALPHSVISAMADIAPNDVTVWTASEAKQPIAAMLFIRHGACATYHIGWTSARGRATGAHHRILIDAGQKFAQQAVRQIDLGTIDTHNAPGLARFKLGSGARPHVLGGSWIKIF